MMDFPTFYEISHPEPKFTAQRKSLGLSWNITCVLQGFYLKQEKYSASFQKNENDENFSTKFSLTEIDKSTDRVVSAFTELLARMEQSKPCKDIGDYPHCAVQNSLHN